MLAGMTSRQFTEWMAFFKIENDQREGRSERPVKGLDSRLEAAFGGYQARRDAAKKRKSK